jgi:hypothetical protein
MQQVAMKWLVATTVTIGLNASGWAQDPDAGQREYLSSCATCMALMEREMVPSHPNLRRNPPI